MDADRILVADDDARIRQMLVRYFEDNGYGLTPQKVQVSVRNSQVELDLKRKAVRTLVEGLGLGGFRDRLSVVPVELAAG